LEAAFWDTSALVPLCIPQHATASLHQLARRYIPVVWWATSVEIQSALARELRAGALTSDEHHSAQQHLSKLRIRWREIQPSESLRTLAEELLERYPLRAADALQLSAAYTWSGNRPFHRRLISGDNRLTQVAQAMGFRAIQIV
jgi:predicted nucleic acid-binding protein